MAYNKQSDEMPTTGELFEKTNLPTAPTRLKPKQGLVITIGPRDPVDVLEVTNANVNFIQEQLALTIFNDMKTDGRMAEVVDSPADFGFRKPSLLVHSRDLTLVGRRLINAIYYIVASDPNHVTYDIDEDYLLWLMRYNSRNKESLKRAITECQKTLIQVEKASNDAINPDWGSVQLLGQAIARGGRVVVTIPRPVRLLLTNPRIYSFLSIRIAATLTSGYATGLYERLVGYQGMGGTGWLTVDEFRKWFTDEKGQPLGREWKFVRRDAIVTPLTQINECTDIKVRFDAKSDGKGKKVTHISFMIERNLDYKIGTEAHHKLYERLRSEFNLRTEEIAEIVKKSDTWSEEYIDKAIEFVSFRIATSAPSRPIRRPGGLLMKALREELRIPSMELVAAQKATPNNTDTQKANTEARTEREKERQREYLRLVENQLTMFSELPEDTRNELLAKFLRTAAYKVKAQEIGARTPRLTPESIIEDELARGMFGSYLLSMKR